MKKECTLLSCFSTILIIVCILSNIVISAFASEVMPLLNNVVTASTSAAISDSGKLTVTNQYYGFDGVTTKAVITTYVEKKTLGLFWTRVDIGQTDNKWVDTIYSYEYSGSHSLQLESTGTYRVVTTFVVYGTGGAADEIERTVERTY